MTELFNNGFEEGDFSAWTSTYKTSGTTLEVITTNPHHGTKHAHIVIDGPDDDVQIRKTVTASATLYTRAYFKFLALGYANGGSYPVALISHSGTTAIATAGIHKTGTEYFLRIRFYASGSWTQSSIGTTALTTGTWYCIELKTVSNASGEATVYLNGAQEVTITGDTSACGNASLVNVGLWWAYNSITPENYIDCVIVADTYIGVESAGASIPVMMHHYNQINKIIRG